MMKRFVPHSLALVIASMVPAFTVVWTVDTVTPLLVGVPIVAMLWLWVPTLSISLRTLGLIVFGGIFVSLTSLLYAKPSGIIYLEWGIAHISDGSIGVAVASFLRILALALPAALIVRAIRPHELLATTAVRQVVPGRIALATLIALRLIPVITADLAETRTARRAAGSTVSFSSLVVTTFVIAIRRAIRMSEIAEVRGFSKPGRVWLSYRRFESRDWALVVISLAIGVLALTITSASGMWNSAI